MKIEMVKFNDGTYGVAKTSVFGLLVQYRDLTWKEDYWWNIGGEYFRCCKGTEEQARKAYEYLTDMGEPIE